MDYMQKDLLPSINPHYDANGELTGLTKSVLCLDNCSTHRYDTHPFLHHYKRLASSHHAFFLNRCEEFYTLCRSFRIKVVFLPAYSPEYNPIELAFNTFKSVVRKNRAVLLTIKNPAYPIIMLWQNNTVESKEAWCEFIQHAGYTVHKRWLRAR